MLMKKAKLLLAALAFAASALFASAQNVNVSGVVSDSETGEPVMGAVVQLQGSTTKYSMTDMGGNYTLNSVPADGTLVVSILGYEGAEVKLNGRTRVEWVSAAEGAKFSQTMHEFVDKITSLGKNVRLEDLRCRN